MGANRGVSVNGYEIVLMGVSFDNTFALEKGEWTGANLSIDYKLEHLECVLVIGLEIVHNELLLVRVGVEGVSFEVGLDIIVF